MVDLPDSQEGLRDMLGLLSAELEKLEEKKKAVISALSKKDKPTLQQPTVQDIIIVFVKEIEKANQYFEFKLYLKEHDVVKPKHDAIKNLKNLVKELKVLEDLRFNKLDFKQIMDAVEFYILDWKRRNRHKESIQGNTSCEVSSEEGNDWYSLMSLKEREVMALCIPLHYTENDVKEAFSVCGNVVSVKLERQGQTANVIFENSVAAKLAPIITARTYSFYVTPAFEEYTYQPKDIEYHKALIKYKEFRNYSNKSQIELVQT